MVAHVKPITGIYSFGKRPNKVAICTFAEEQDVAIDAADAKAELALNEIGMPGASTFYYFSTYTAMSGIHVPVGVTTVELGGYYAEGDGGRARYVKSVSEPSTAGGKFQSADGAWWALAETRPNIRMFGAYSDGSHDDHQAIINAGVWCKANLVRHLDALGGQIGLSASTYTPYGVQVHGALNSTDPYRPATQVITLAGAVYTNNIMWGLNTTDNVNGTSDGFWFGGGLEDICFIDDPDEGGAGLGTAIGFISFGVNVEMRRVGGRFMYQVGQRPPLGDPIKAYCDNFRLTDCFFSDPVDGTVPAFLISGLGDGLIVEGLNGPSDGSMGISLVPYTDGQVYSGVIRQVINCSMYIDSPNITIDNWHAEGCTLTIGSEAHVVLRNSNISESTTLTTPPIIYESAIGNSNSLELDNVTFRWLGSPTQFNSPCAFDVAMGAQGRLVVHNCRRSVNGTNSSTIDTGIRICESDLATPIPGWAAYADLLSRDGEVMPRYNVVYDKAIPAAVSHFQGPFDTTINAADSGAWTIATGTYYYRAARLIDKVNLIGEVGTNAEVSAVVSSTSKLVNLSGYSANNTAGNGPAQGMTRFYRGTATGSYDHYADVPIISSDPANITDDGTYIGGVPWVGRSAGGVDTLRATYLNTPYRVVAYGKVVSDITVVSEVGDAALSLKYATKQMVICYDNLTSDRAITLPPVAIDGDEARVTRNRTTGHNITIAYGSGGGSTWNIGAPSNVGWADFVYDASAGYWQLSGAGTA